MWQWHPLPGQICGRPGWHRLQAAQSAHRCRSVQVFQLCWSKTSSVRVSSSLASRLLGARLLMKAASVPSSARDAQSAARIKECWSVGQGLLPVAQAIEQLETFQEISCLCRLSRFHGNYQCIWFSCSCLAAGLIQPSLLDDGQVCVDMGEPILEAERVPTRLPPTQAMPCTASELPMS